MHCPGSNTTMSSPPSSYISLLDQYKNGSSQSVLIDATAHEYRFSQAQVNYEQYNQQQNYAKQQKYQQHQQHQQQYQQPAPATKPQTSITISYTAADNQPLENQFHGLELDNVDEFQFQSPVPKVNIEKAPAIDRNPQIRQPIQSPQAEFFSAARIPGYASQLALPSTSARPVADTLSPARNNSRGSVISTNSTVNSLYSSGNFSTDIGIQETLDHVNNDIDSAPPESKRGRFKELFKSSKVKSENITVHTNSSNQHYYNSIFNFLNESVYSGSTKGVLKLNYERILEIYIFGNELDSIFNTPHQFMNYLITSHLESGELQFNQIPLPSITFNIDQLYEYFENILLQLDDFNDVLNSYKVQEEKKNTGEFASISTFDKLEEFANRKGVTLPMAQSMFGTWLLSYSKGGGRANYSDERIMNQFRKAARMGLIFRKLNLLGYFNETLKLFNKYEQVAIQRYLNKDNDFAISMAVSSIAEYYQFVHGYDTAINYWECDGHITKDVESCNLAIWGLNDGYGSGNKVKTMDKIGGGLKKNKFNTKRRIAHLTRILSKNGGQAEYGTSWVWKEKYD